VSPYRNQVAAALAAVTIDGPTRYAWLGRRSRPLPGSTDAALDESERRNYLLFCLREELYASFYCHGRPVPARWGAPGPVAADPRLVEAMARANPGRGSWEPGWTVDRLDGRDAIVAHGRLRTRVRLDDCRSESAEVALGAAVSIRLPKELQEQSPGFYTVVAEVADTEPSADFVRVYWNVGRSGAPPLVSALAARLNGERVPFRLKVASHPFHLDRCDASVLYLRSDIFRQMTGALREIAARLITYLRPQIPAFTLELAPGVGLAEDVGSGSFGQRRCGLLAEAIVLADEQRIARPGERLDAVAAHFAEAGVAIDAPYLEPSLAGRHVL
jgi:hypothetical protein